MITLKHRTANPFGTHRLWLSKCLTNNTVSVSKLDSQSTVNITAVTAYKNNLSIHKVEMYQCQRLELMDLWQLEITMHNTYTSTGRMTAFMLPYDARQMRSRKTVSATFAGLSSSLGLSGSL